MKTVVIGAGASGLMAGIAAAKAGDPVLILEAADRPGKKLLATGNGRCNLMNEGEPVYYGDADFAKAVLKGFDQAAQRAFWAEYGLPLRTDAENRVYPFSLQAASVLETLLLSCRLLGVEIRCQSRVSGIFKAGHGFDVEASGQMFKADRVILSTGGAAQPKLGGNRDGERLLSPFHLQMIPQRPALTSLLTDKRSVAGLSGIRARCVLRLVCEGVACFERRGEVLFTDEGISGICVMQCARFVQPACSQLLLDLTEGTYPEEETLQDELKRRQALFASCTPETLLRGWCVPHLAYAVCKQAGLPLRGEKAADLTTEQLKALSKALKAYRLSVQGVKGFETAQLSCGGVACDQINPESMEVYRVPGLHITGELLDVDGDCGGFNLMFAFASGYLAGINKRR